MDDHSLREYAVHKGMRTLQDQLKELVLEGATSMDEAIRIGLGDR